MGDHEQEQLEEIEVLSSIFMTELIVESADPGSSPKIFSLQLKPHPNEEEENFVGLKLICTLPPEYPDCLPELQAQGEKGLSQTQLEEVLSVALGVAQENIGMPSIFIVIEAVKDWLLDNNIQGQDGSMYSDMIRRHQQKEVEAKKQHLKAEIVQMADRERFAEVEKVVDEEELARIRKRQAGTQVTVESFLAWRKTFDAEQEQLAKSSNVPLPTVTSSTSSAPVSLIDDRSLTGKQFFLLQAAKGASDGKLIAEDEDEEALIREGEADTGAGDNWNRNHDSDDNDEDYEEGDEESDHNDD